MTRGAIGLVIDPIILALPIIIVVLFQLSLNRKFSVVIIFPVPSPVTLPTNKYHSVIVTGIFRSFTAMLPVAVGCPRTPAPPSGSPPTLPTHNGTTLVCASYGLYHR